MLMTQLNTNSFGLPLPQPPSSPPFFTRCHPCLKPPNLSWLGTGTELRWIAYYTALLVSTFLTSKKLINQTCWRVTYVSCVWCIVVYTCTGTGVKGADPFLGWRKDKANWWYPLAGTNALTLLVLWQEWHLTDRKPDLLYPSLKVLFLSRKNTGGK